MWFRTNDRLTNADHHNVEILHSGPSLLGKEILTVRDVLPMYAVCKDSGRVAAMATNSRLGRLKMEYEIPHVHARQFKARNDYFQKMK